MAIGSSRGSTWEAIREQVLQRDNYTCVYCGNEATQADHIIPKSLGGKDELSNLVAACLRCNSTKGNKTNIRLNYYSSRFRGKL